MSLKPGLVVLLVQILKERLLTSELDELGRLDCIITQFVDNLSQRARVMGNKVFEIHDNMLQAVRLACGQRYPWSRLVPGWMKGRRCPMYSSGKHYPKADYRELLPTR